MKRSRLWGMIVVLLAVLMAMQVTVYAAAKVELRLSFWAGSPAEAQIWEQLAKEFEKANPGVTVKTVQGTPADYLTKLQTMIAGGNAPDAGLLSTNGWFAALADRKVLADLGTYVKRDALEVNVADFYPKVWDSCKFDGILYGIPQNTGGMAVEYNKDIFDAAGVPYPADNWTYMDFANTFAKLTKDTNGDGKIDQWGYGYNIWWGPLYPWIYSFGGDILSADRKKCVIDSAESIAAIQFFADLANKYKAAAPMETIQIENSYVLFVNGKSAGYPGAAWDPAVFETLPFRWDAAPIPLGPTGKRVTTGEVVLASIFKSSKHKTEAWKLVKFLTSVESQEKTQRSIPTRKSAVLSFFNGKPPARRDVYVKALDYFRPLPQIAQLDEINSIVNREVELVCLQKKAVKDAVLAIKKEVDAILAE